MLVHPIVIDSRPGYLRQAAESSLAQMPLGESTLCAALLARARQWAGGTAGVLPAFAPRGGYAERMAAAAGEPVTVMGGFADALAVCEPADWLLLIDAAQYPLRAWPAGELQRALREPRRALHVVVLAGGTRTAQERVLLDEQGGVRRIERTYRGVTALQSQAVCCSLVSGAAVREARVGAFASLSELRARLAVSGVPGYDVFLDGGAIDLSRKRGLLELCGAGSRERGARGRGRGDREIERSRDQGRMRDRGSGIGDREGRGAGCTVHPTARLVGRVVLQAEAQVEARATIVGPAVVGRGAQVGRGATVIQCVVGPGAVVPPETTVHHDVVVGRAAPMCGAEAPNGNGASGRSAKADSPVGNGQAWAHRSAAPDGAPPHGPAPLNGPTPPAAEDRSETGPPETEEGPLLIREDGGSGLAGAERRGIYPALKCAMEAGVAAAALLVLSPLLAAVALLVKATSPGPALYGDLREGKGGRVFRCWKFRSMRKDASQQQRALYKTNQVDGPQFKMAADPRITPIGAILRKTNVDELPQLINVAMGQMSLIGPRPSPFRENQICVAWRRARLSVRPGITGLWQICRHNRAAGDFHQWIYYDILYVRHLSPMLDIKILLATLATGGGRWSVPLSWMLSDGARHVGVLDVPTRTPILALGDGARTEAACSPV